MSRIHEALKKAEQERSASPRAEAAASPTDLANVPPGKQGNGAVAVATEGAVQAVIPRPGAYLHPDDLRARCAHPRWNFHANANVFSDAISADHGAEQFRTLRSRLYQLRGNQPLRTILVTSAVPNEGKTFVVNNLAQAFIRQADRSALIIDADLRRSHLHIPMGAPLTPGLSDYLLGEADEMAVIQQSGDGKLCFIPGGKAVANPSELLINGRLKKLIDWLAPAFSWVIVDSPPCLMVADASILADLCDGVLLVVRAASTPAGTAQRACQEMHGKKIVGVVLNSVEQSESYGSSYYDYGKQ